MTDLPSSTEDLRGAVIRFDGALSKLENSLNIALEKLSAIDASPFENMGDEDLAADNNILILREELASAKSREKELEQAVGSARAALGEAIDDIRQVLGPV